MLYYKLKLIRYDKNDKKNKINYSRFVCISLFYFKDRTLTPRRNRMFKQN